MKPIPKLFNLRRTFRGFTLIEMMVGMAVGLVTVLVITQAVGAIENQKRITTGSADAQDNGLIAMTQIEQDVRNAGAGFADSAALDCGTMHSYYDDGTTEHVPAPQFAGAIAPVSITDKSATGNTTNGDIITIKRGTEFLGSIPATITSDMPQNSSELNVSFVQGFSDGDLVVVSQGGECTIMQVTQVQNSALKLQHNPGGSAPYNPSGNCYNQGCSGFPTYTENAEIFNIGNMVVHAYSLSTADYSLQMADSSTNLTATTTLNLVKNVVALDAEYGVSSGINVQPVSSWEPPIGDWASLNADEVKRIKAIRVTIVVRSDKKEGSNVTTAVTDGAGNAIDVSHVTDWERYRYRVYQTIIPLRNIIWANV